MKLSVILFNGMTNSTFRPKFPIKGFYIYFDLSYKNVLKEKGVPEHNNVTEKAVVE
jgi:hypothetical protein